MLDVFLPDPVFGRRSLESLIRVAAEGDVLSCDVVWSEIRPMFADSVTARKAMESAGVGFDPLTCDAALLAGEVWKEYLGSGGERTRRVVADFLIGAHALEQADRLLTRDRGFYRRYFKGLSVLDPTLRND